MSDDQIARMKKVARPFIQEINRLEKEYGFDRPLHQLQPLMIPLGDLIALRREWSDD